MGQIKVKFDNVLKQSDIVIPIVNSSSKESTTGMRQSFTDVDQTLVYGVISPLIKINNIVIDFDSVISFSLSCDSITPQVYLTVHDRYQLTSTLDVPGSDNELRVQIIPQFSDVYKKINLTFLISSVNINNSDQTISVIGNYKSPKLISSNLRAFGEISTYELFETIAKETGLGFASNVDGSQDKRYIYCDYKSYTDVLNRAINTSHSDAKVYEWWIDFWNNINFVDTYERYNTIDDKKDMNIWISTVFGQVQSDTKIKPVLVEAAIHNLPHLNNMETFTVSYETVNNSIAYNSDCVYSVYYNEKEEYIDYLCYNGDIKRDMHERYEYLGEVYGDYDYIMARKKRDVILNKMYSESIEVSLNAPVFGLTRGSKVNFYYFTNNAVLDGIKRTASEQGVIEEPKKTQIPLDELDFLNNVPDQYKLDKSVSGQYLITSCIINYNGGRWSYDLKMCRPVKYKQNIIIDKKE